MYQYIWFLKHVITMVYLSRMRLISSETLLDELTHIIKLIYEFAVQQKLLNDPLNFEMTSLTWKDAYHFFIYRIKDREGDSNFFITMWHCDIVNVSKIQKKSSSPGFKIFRNQVWIPRVRNFRNLWILKPRDIF